MIKTEKYYIPSYVILILQIAAISVFWGRAWQHWFWDAPYRSLLWDERWMSGIIEGLFGMDWEDYVTSSRVDAGIQTWIKVTGVVYFLAGLSAIFIRQWGRIAKVFIFLGGINLILLSVLYFKERFFAFGQFFEYTLQMLAPFLLWYAYRIPVFSQRWVIGLKVAIVLTFTCHGLYAIGYYPRPVQFQEMVMNILGLPENWVKPFLDTAGILDFVLSILIFLPWRKVQIAGLVYATIWGFFTSIARVWAFVHWEFLSSGLHQWWYETVYRFPHFLLPLALLLLLIRPSADLAKTAADQ
ncbi:MAG: hypothetical protein R2828_31250 [Saprospiraceae bacterium]